jgi:hypothetical protein
MSRAARADARWSSPRLIALSSLGLTAAGLLVLVLVPSVAAFALALAVSGRGHWRRHDRRLHVLIMMGRCCPRDAPRHRLRRDDHRLVDRARGQPDRGGLHQRSRTAGRVRTDIVLLALLALAVWAWMRPTASR